METLLKTDLALLLARDDAAEDFTPAEDKLTADEDVLMLEETDEAFFADEAGAFSGDFSNTDGVDESPPHPLSNRVDINALASSDCLKNMIKFMRGYPFYYGGQ